MQKNQLFIFALESMNKAYAPYSNFKVGAAILAEDGKIYSGCNVENVAFPSGSCAEQGAISAMINGGSSTISEILVISAGQRLITPCGACLQRIREFAADNAKIHLANPNGIQKTYLLSELLPVSFEEFSND